MIECMLFSALFLLEIIRLRCAIFVINIFINLVNSTGRVTLNASVFQTALMHCRLFARLAQWPERLIRIHQKVSGSNPLTWTISNFSYCQASLRVTDASAEKEVLWEECLFFLWIYNWLHSFPVLKWAQF